MTSYCNSLSFMTDSGRYFISRLTFNLSPTILDVSGQHRLSINKAQSWPQISDTFVGRYVRVRASCCFRRSHSVKQKTSNTICSRALTTKMAQVSAFQLAANLFQVTNYHDDVTVHEPGGITRHSHTEIDKHTVFTISSMSKSFWNSRPREM